MVSIQLEGNTGTDFTRTIEEEHPPTSVAGLFLTTECVVVEEQQEGTTPPMLGGGEMGGMYEGPTPARGKRAHSTFTPRCGTE